MFSRKDNKRFQFLSSLFGREDKVRRRLLPQPIQEGPRFNYLKLGGSFGRPRIRHCDTWDFDSSNPRFLAARDGKRLSSQRDNASKREMGNDIVSG